MGSSRKRRLRGSSRSFASARRERSPPEKPADAQRIVAPEAEPREVLARRLDREVAADAPHLVDRGERGFELAEVLIEVALLEIRAALDVASIFGGAAAGEELQERGSCPSRSARRRRCARRAGREISTPAKRARPPRDAARPLQSSTMSPDARAGAKRNATLSATAHTSSGRSSRSSLSSILRRLCACFVFCPAMFLRMKSSVLSMNACCRSSSARSRARSSSRATA